MLPALHLIPGYPIPTYFLIISLAATVGLLWFLRRAGKFNMSAPTAIDLAMVALVCGFAGARLLHVYWEEPTYYAEAPLRILQVWNGGFVYLGGVAGALVGGFLYCVLRREPFWFWADIAVIPASFAYAVGRLACFFNGCCYGKVCELPWAIHLHGEFRHPTQLYASLYEVLVLAVLLNVEPRVRMSGVLIGTWMVLHPLGRVLMEIFRDDPRGAFVHGLSLGMWMSLAMGLLGLASIVIRGGHRRLGP